MPRLMTVLSADDMAARKKVRTPKADILVVQMHHLQDIISQNGLGADIELEEGEDQRTQKRRYTTAAKQLGRQLKWRSAPDGQLSFELTSPKLAVEPDPNKPRAGRPKKTA